MDYTTLSSTNKFCSLIAVHGLGGDWKDTWEDDSQNWLQSFLPTKVEKLRVLTFGYSSSVAFSSSTPDLRDLAIKLLNSVNRKRNTPQVYPMKPHPTPFLISFRKKHVRSFSYAIASGELW